MTIGQRIMQIRVSCGLTQEEFGARLGTSRQTVSKWELDIAIPEVDKIVEICRLFSVTADSVLIDGISTFDDGAERFVCGIYKSSSLEIAETEHLALVYYCNPDASVFGAKVYAGFDSKKRLRAVCEYSTADGKTKYAYTADTGEVISNDSSVKRRLGEKYDTEKKRSLYRSEIFFTAYGEPPSVKEVGIKNALTQWRMAASLLATASRFSVSLCTDKSEYIFDISPQGDNVYCAVSNNTATEFGLLARRQFFRIRNFGDNSESYCSSFCDLGFIPTDTPLPTEECVVGQCTVTDAGLFFGIKRYTDDEIILCGCGGDEYRYSKKDKKTERFTFDKTQ